MSSIIDSEKLALLTPEEIEEEIAGLFGYFVLKTKNKLGLTEAMNRTYWLTTYLTRFAKNFEQDAKLSIAQ